jgi:hypothetical protein
VRNWKALAGDVDFRAAFAVTEKDGKLVDRSSVSCWRS